jgi:hypothetical protein
MLGGDLSRLGRDSLGGSAYDLVALGSIPEIHVAPDASALTPGRLAR